MSRLLVVSENNVKLPFVKEKYDFIKLRRKGDMDHMMEVFEYQDTHRIVSTREKIEKLNPSRIVVLGKLKDYRWLATVICRIFGHFNSWIDQFDSKSGKTTIKINGEDVELLAFDNAEDWRESLENKS